MNKKKLEELKTRKILSVIIGFFIILIEIGIIIYRVKSNIRLDGSRLKHRHDCIIVLFMGIVFFIYGFIPIKKEGSKRYVKRVEKIENDVQNVSNYFFEENGDLHINGTIYRHYLITEICTINNVVQFNYCDQPILLYLNDEKEALKLWKEMKKKMKL